MLASAAEASPRRFAPIAVAAGAVVVDNTSAYRMDPEVPLVVPEVNAGDLKLHKGIIANPNCSTIIMNVPVWPLHQASPIRRLVVSTYQAVSGQAQGHGRVGRGARAFLAKEPYARRSCRIAAGSTCFPTTATSAPTATTWRSPRCSTRRGRSSTPAIRITATCVRVPVLRAHSESINIEFSRPMPEARIREILATAPGVKIVDDRAKNYFPMPVDATGRDEVLVGRIRQDTSQDNCLGIDMFVSGDQIRKGAALNAVQIAELL